MNTAEKTEEYRLYTEKVLAAWSAEDIPPVLKEAMRYSLLAPGKRLRAILCLAACETAGGKREDALPFAAAIEMIHAYSLIHDDLPAMDNDTLRRGLPTNHVVYGEAMAILAGDSLLNEAFTVMAECPSQNALRALRYVSRKSGARGMAGGQALDISLEGSAPDRENVRKLHLGKTAALFEAACVSGMMLAGAGKREIAACEEFARHLGLAFQIEDDLLDLYGDEKTLGKHTGKDRDENKLTWVRCVGEEQARLDVYEHTEKAVRALDIFGNKAEFLQSLAIVMRDRVK